VIIDCHVHTAACVPGHGSMSPRLMNSVPFRFMRWKFGLVGADESTERGLEAKLVETIENAAQLDAAVVLAFDAVYDDDGRTDEANTHLYITNDYVMELAARHRKVLFGASVHPYRVDAIAELERCVRGGAVLMKWLPITQGMNPADERCIPFYEALAHHKLPLLCHTGGEQSLPRVDDSLADPMLLEPALKRGVKVIMAHCGTRARPTDRDFLPQFMRLAREHEHCYGDTSALDLPMRWYAYESILEDGVVREKLIHGSDWPILALPPVGKLDFTCVFGCMRESNWMKRDVMIKKAMGFDDAYWHRAARVLRL
jgi:predicted TIM-barrel fold metal-dependent hydrolase